MVNIIDANIVSIIIPVYNVEKYLERCLDSVINQTYKNIEIIIINDGSKDNSQSIIDRYAERDERIKPVIQKNQGLSEARNTGIRNSSGEYYYFLDSDDYIKDNTIELMLQNNDSEDIIIANLIAIDSKGNSNYRSFVHNLLLPPQELIKSDTKFDFFFGRAYGINACNKLYKSDFIKQHGIYFQKNDEIYAEDLLFNLKCYTNSPKIKIIEDYTYYYEFNPNSITKTFKPNLRERFTNLISEFYNYCEKNNRLQDNNDLLTMTFCIAMSNIAKNIYDFKDNKVNQINQELKIFYCEITKIFSIDRDIVNNVSNKTWKYFNSIILLMFEKRWFVVVGVIQWIRFKLQSVRK